MDFHEGFLSRDLRRFPGQLHSSWRGRGQLQLLVRNLEFVFLPAHKLVDSIWLCRQSNPDIQAWMKNKGYTDYAKLEEYYENKLVDRILYVSIMLLAPPIHPPHCNSLLDLVGAINKSYVVWQEIFDNGLKVNRRFS